MEKPCSSLFFLGKALYNREVILDEEGERMRTRVLKLLQQANRAYISDGMIADRLGIPRKAVWKHIGELREMGYRIERAARNGYVLRETADLLLPEAIASGLDTEIVGKHIVHCEVLVSTNPEAKRLAEEGAADGTVVVAEEQTGGHGRRDRLFFSPHGKGIWCSYILRPTFLPREAPKCTLMAAVAISRAMEAFGIAAEIKWPNDILHEGKKVVGILTEMRADMDRIRYVVIGTGISINIGEEEFPEPLRGVATSLSIICGEPVSRIAFFQTVLHEMDEIYCLVEREGFASVLSEWRRYSVTLGQEVRVIDVRGDTAFEGRAADIDEDGALLVDTAEGRRRVDAGEVSIRPRACAR